MKHFKPRVAAAAAAAALVAGCGGGGADTTPKSSVGSVKVFGDSLADAGTFGYKFTVQGSGSLVYPERIAQTYGVGLCPYFKSTDGTTITTNPTAGCTDYAVGGGRINNFTNPTSPVSITQQLATAASVNGSYKASDLIVIDGGGNDGADLVGAYLRVPTDGGASFAALLRTLLDANTVNSSLAAGASGLAKAGGLYMTALADAFYASIRTNTLDKGATSVVLLNMPGINNTPRFQTVLAAIAASAGGGAAGATARAQAEAVFKSWFEAYNAELAAKVGSDARVVLVDFYNSFNDQVANPSQYALQNTTTPACPATGVGADGLPTYSFPTCTDTALSATTPPAGATGGANWWRSYGFSDSFHPTPYGHQLLAQRISVDLAKSGRL